MMPKLCTYRSLVAGLPAVWAAAWLALVLSLQGPALAAEGSAAVGQVSLLVGQARVTSASGQTRALERGAEVRIGDRLETEAGGHVHLQFVDGGRMSLRPSSRLVIEDYTAPQSGRPSSGAIRFRLEDGVVRSITGAWGEGARDRFRLNTPLAAIGVKGTDFAVRAESDKTAAAVYTGAIVVTPLDMGCAATLGPCNNGKERLLTEAMKGQMVELSRAQSVPQLVPAVDLLAAGTRAAPLGVASNARAAGGPSVVAASSSAGGTDRSPASAVAAVDRSIGEALAANAARQASNVPAPVVTDFTWGRNQNALVGDTLSVPSSQLMSQGARPTVGIFSYTLFTTAAPLSANAVLGGGEAAVSLRLADSFAGLVDIYGQAIETVKVTGGQLNLDFARSLFSTSLNLSGQQLGQDSLRASGNISSAGLFYAADGNQIVAGAINPSGKQAGYLFEKRVQPGIVRGITLWGR